ncbi:c-type cytochrome [Pedobacter sp. CG_S7]|uniref:c-type cytochrome n=1 Tax=Pedobacter sp. CG_S7 TaxID=3143930 RepID=UPI0033945F42
MMIVIAVITQNRKENKERPTDLKSNVTTTIPLRNNGEMISYGRELIVHTSLYLGPKGSVAQISNGMNCQNCHLDAGTKPYANNFSVFFFSYPKLSNRSGRVEQASERINECFERSLNGIALKEDSKEMKAILAYLEWVAKDLVKSSKLKAPSVEKLPYLDYAADPIKGKIVYIAKCKSCHENNSTIPPLWGSGSYNDGAGMYRLRNFSGFVKNNMPLGASYQNTQLTDEEAWNVAAYVNSQPRPHKDQYGDYKVLSTKPIDFPFGLYQDEFNEKQHKYGPFKPIEKKKKSNFMIALSPF